MKCIVPECQKEAHFFTGYLFTRQGQEILSDTNSFGWCQAHVGMVGLKIAIPVFDSPDAVLLFAEKHYQVYLRRVAPRRKIIIAPAQEARP